MVLAAIACWGVEQILQRINGVFALALWDRTERQLILARDRRGEQPLYYGHSGDTLVFGSSLKTLAAHPDWYGEVDREALALYLRYSYVPAPWSIYKGIAKLPAAHYVVVSDNGRGVGEPHCYWDLADIAARGRAASSREDAAVSASVAGVGSADSASADDTAAIAQPSLSR